MFEKFGKMDYEELIRTAAAEREEGDLEALVTLAVENGLEKEDAEDYMDYIVDSLATPYMAAVAKIEGEAKELGIKGHQVDQKDTILALLDGNDELCLAVRKKREIIDGMPCEDPHFFERVCNTGTGRNCETGRISYEWQKRSHAQPGL